MKIIEPGYEILGDYGPLTSIEKIGRVCYKSEDKITPKSAEGFCGAMFRNGHTAMLEHYRFAVEVDPDTYYGLVSLHPRFLVMTSNLKRHIVSGSATGFYQLWLDIERMNQKHNDYDPWRIVRIISAIVDYYDCGVLFGNWETGHNTPNIKVIPHNALCKLSDDEYIAHEWMSVKFTCDRGVSHEIVRHRDASFAQESTRYCNYGNGKFGKEITVIKPCFWDEYSSALYGEWEIACRNAEKAYMTMLDNGATPQEARSILPNSLKTDVVMTATMKEWKHFFNLRALGKTGTPHPQMVQIALPLYHECVDKGLIR